MDIIKQFEKGVMSPLPENLRIKSQTTYWPSQARCLVPDKVFGSKAVGKCIRSSWYSKMGYKPTNPVTTRGYIIFMFGREFENFLQKNLIKAGVSYDEWCNVKFDYEIDTKYSDDATKPILLSGEVDQFVHDENDRETIYGLEIKTYYGYAAKKEIMGTKRPYTYGSPKLENLMQVMLYLDVYKDILDTFYLFYCSRDNVEHRQFEVKLKEKNNTTIATNDGRDDNSGLTLEGIYKSYFELDKYIQTKTLPPCDFYKEYPEDILKKMYDLGTLNKTDKEAYEKGKLKKCDFHCSYCDYKEQCLKDDGIIDEIVNKEQEENEDMEIIMAPF